MRKTFAQLDPVANRPVEVSEQYYTAAHIPLIQRLYADHTDQVQRYVPQKVLAQWDPSGGFHRPPDAWRFIVLHHRETVAVPMSPAWGLVASRDHEQFLENLRLYNVDREEVLVDRLAGQTSTVKYLFRFTGDAEATRRVMTGVASRFAVAGGARLLLLNEVASEREVAPLSRPGQLVTANVGPTDVRFFAELYFDNADVAQRFFADEEVRVPLLVELGDDRVSGYRVEEFRAYDAR